MEKRIAIYQGNTGLIRNNKILFESEGIERKFFEKMEALEAAVAAETIHLIIAELKMDEAHLRKGIQEIYAIRDFTQVPLLVISGEVSESVKVMALNSGADDFITTDVSPLVLIARVKAHLRRFMKFDNHCEKAGKIYQFDDLLVDDANHQVLVRGKDVKMTPIEYKILRLLLKEQGTVLSIDRIYESIWKMRAVGADNVIAVHIRHIRKKIENNPDEPRYLKAVWGMGYKVG